MDTDDLNICSRGYSLYFSSCEAIDCSAAGVDKYNGKATLPIKKKSL